MLQAELEKGTEIREGIRFINAEKLGEHEIDTEKLKNKFMSMFRDIKKDIDNGKSIGDISTQ